MREVLKNIATGAFVIGLAVTAPIWGIPYLLYCIGEDVRRGDD